MSYQSVKWRIMSWAREARTGRPGLKATLLVLAERVDDWGYCYPSQGTIAHETEQSVSTVGRALASLEALGFIRREKRYNPHGGIRLSDGYWLLCEDLPVNLNDTVEKDLPIGQPEQFLSVSSAGVSTNEVPVTTEQTCADEDLLGLSKPTFAMAKAAFPKRSGGYNWAEAEKAWNARLKQGDTAEEMYEGTLRYYDYIEGTGRLGTEFVLMASTFYGKQRRFAWEWDLPAATSTTPKRIVEPQAEEVDPEPWLRNVHTTGRQP